VQIVTSREILHEHIEVLMRPVHWLPRRRSRIWVFLARNAALVEISGAAQGCRDPNDDMFLETARVGGAEYLVTFDRDLLDAQLVAALEAEGITVASLATFLHALRDRGIITGDAVMPKAESNGKAPQASGR
jgi:putative PIN family toxin of toxin-antitoxin system